MAIPDKFLWGGSISAAQCEGGWDEGGKSPVQVDFGDPGSTTDRRWIHYLNADGTRGKMRQFDHLPKGAKYQLFDDIRYTNHVGIDFYHRYKEDIALFAELGFTTFNTTISWARIYPHGVEGGVNKEGVEFYRNVFKECRKYGIDPVITLYKYDEPVYLEETYGNWTNREMIHQFVEFARVCFSEYKGLVDKWLTFNEINILLHFDGKEGKQFAFEELHNQMVAAAKAVKVAHEIDENISVGCMIAGFCSYPYTCDPEDVIANYKEFQEKFAYCADTMVRGYYPSYAKRIWKQNNVSLEISEEDKKDYEIRMPDVEEYDKDMILGFEKDVLGIYLSGHPLEKYRNIMEKMISARTIDFQPDDETGIPKVYDGQKVIIGGMITEKTIKYTRNNKVMAFLTVEDLMGTVEIVVFPRDYEKWQTLINEDARVFIQGRVNAEDDKPSKLILEKVRAFDDIPREIWIQFKDREDYAQKEQELLNYLRGSVGTSAVVIYLKDVKAIKRLPAGYHVQISDFLLEELKKKYGDSNVKVVERVLKNF